MPKHTSRPPDTDAAASDEGAPARPPEGFLAQGVNFTRHFVRDRLNKPAATPVSDIAPGQAQVVSVGGEKVAAFRDDAGVLHAVSAVCTHRGCVVDWHAAVKTWDCACHGSRFDYDGRVIQGPARRDLEPKQIED